VKLVVLSRRIIPVNLQEWAGVTEFDPRATLAVVFTDIIDSTTLARSVGDREMFDMLVNHFEAARALELLYGGFEIKLIGDAYMVAFRTADAALQFAMDFRRETGDPRIAIRVGIHVGQVRIKDDDIYGLMVNYAARLSHIAVPGEDGIFLSTSAKRDVESEYGSSQKEVRFVQVSATSLKGFGTREEVWQVITPEIRIARNERIAAKRKEEARKNPKPAVAPPTNTLIPVYKPQLVKLPDPPPTTLRPRYKPDSKTLDGIMRRLTYPPDKKD
jgi:class 3 adenylate cyclase